MNRLFTILSMVALLVSHTSCNDSVMDFESPSVEMMSREADQRAQDLILQARQGDVEAYNSLALCYRDGDLDRAKTYSRYAENEMDKYQTQMRYAAEADEKAAMYLQWAADALSKM